ncbi:Protein of unknown function [Pyronema omphalodes CBS 100304]|uniref:Uncharacterized protein n=1 Tax=Pyronema omphalodes (strain CBS 100304) TaxID=1076935 RepID=U4LWK3_PYROM|nr:Protein of unknown function [Pyronema omphalodes CBS 100304]
MGFPPSKIVSPSWNICATNSSRKTASSASTSPFWRGPWARPQTAWTLILPRRGWRSSMSELPRRMLSSGEEIKFEIWASLWPGVQQSTYEFIPYYCLLCCCIPEESVTNIIILFYDCCVHLLCYERIEIFFSIPYYSHLQNVLAFSSKNSSESNRLKKLKEGTVHTIVLKR